jgi:hypothetical protein
LHQVPDHSNVLFVSCSSWAAASFLTADFTIAVLKAALKVMQKINRKQTLILLQAFWTEEYDQFLCPLWSQISLALKSTRIKVRISINSSREKGICNKRKLKLNAKQAENATKTIQSQTCFLGNF